MLHQPQVVDGGHVVSCQIEGLLEHLDGQLVLPEVLEGQTLRVVELTVGGHESDCLVEVGMGVLIAP